MIRLREYIESSVQGDTIDEGLLQNGAALAIVRNMDQKEFVQGLLNMADSILDSVDPKTAVLDYPVKQRPLWNMLLKMNKKNLFGVMSISDSEEFSQIMSAFEENNRSPLRLTPELRRILKNANGVTKVSEVSEIFPIKDNLKDGRYYVFTLNKQVKITDRLFGVVGKKVLELVLSRASEEPDE